LELGAFKLWVNCIPPPPAITIKYCEKCTSEPDHKYSPIPNSSPSVAAQVVCN
jgi:hypothetical protein